MTNDMEAADDLAQELDAEVIFSPHEMKTYKERLMLMARDPRYAVSITIVREDVPEAGAVNITSRVTIGRNIYDKTIQVDKLIFRDYEQHAFIWTNITEPLMEGVIREIYKKGPSVNYGWN